MQDWLSQRRSGEAALPCRRVLLHSQYGPHLRLDLPGRGGQPSVKHTNAIANRASRCPLCPLQVRSVPVRKDDEVTVVRGTYKVGLHAGKQLAGPHWNLSPSCAMRQHHVASKQSMSPLRDGWLRQPHGEA